MEHASWQVFCPKFQVGNASLLAIWDPSVNDFTFCYRQLFLGISHTLLLLTCGFYVGRLSWRRLNAPVLSPSQRATLGISTAAWIIRLIASVGTVLSLLLSFFLQILWLKDWPAFGVVSYAQSSICVLVWILHGHIAWKLARSAPCLSFDGADTFVIFTSWFPAFLIWSFEFRATLLGHSPNQVFVIITIVIFSLQVLFLTSGVVQLYSSCIYVRGYDVRPVSSRRSSVSSNGSGDIDSSDNVNLINGMPPSQSASSVSASTLTAAKLGQPHFWGPLRFLLFLWVDPLMQQGADGFLHKADDLFELPAKLKADAHAQTVQKALARNPKTSRFYLPQILIGIWGMQWLFLGIMKLAYSFLQYTSPLFVNVLVSSIENPASQPEYYGYLFGLGLITVNLMSATTQLHYAFQVEKLNLCMRGALVDTVYSKLLRVHTSALSESMASSQVVNLVGTDCEKVSGNVQYLHQMWAMPLQIAVALYLLYQQVGFAFIGGLVFIILLVPLNQVLASKISSQVEQNLKERDARVRLMSEALKAIRVIKFHAWEKWFCSRVAGVRIKEMKTVKTIKYLDACCVYFWATTPMIMSVLTFTTYVWMGNSLTAAKVFTCLSVFGLVIVPLNAIPWIITGTVEAWISAKRLQKFLTLSEIDVGTYYSLEEGDSASENVVTMRKGCFSWSRPKEGPTLDHNLVDQASEGKNQLVDIDVSVKRGELVGVVGKVGSGKSSLLQAILAEMYATDGMVQLQPKSLLEGFAFVPQDNWIQQGTIMSNIHFSLPTLDLDLYHKVLEACALQQDLQGLTHGSQTQIGEQGVTLSGGQKARIALARAVLQNKEVILLDDPLSAVDAQVANHIFDQCILKLLRGKTRLLVTHHLDFLQAADRILVMEQGKIVHNGPPHLILPTLPSFQGPKRKAEGERTTETQTETETESDGETSGQSDGPQVAKKGRERKRRSKRQLVEEEQRDYGSLKASVYRQYWKAVGNLWAIAVLLSLFLMQASYNATDWWLSYWVTHEQVTINPVSNQSQSDWRYYLQIYSYLGAGNSLLALLRSFVFAYAGLLAAYRLHDRLLVKVLRAAISFFDSTPSGRILNRFAKDVTSVDNQLPFMLNIVLANIFQLLGTFIIICYGLPWFMLVLIGLAPLYYLIQRYYRATSREIKRIATLTQSPLYTLYSETAAGLPTIRAMRAQPYFYGQHQRLLDDNLRAQFADMASSKWLHMRLQLLALVIISAVVLMALLLKAAAGTTGLVLSYALTVVGLLTSFIASFIETEKEMVSVERIAHYLTDIQEEMYDGIYTAPAAWPQLGAIDFEDVSLRYRPDLPQALSGLTLAVKPAERIGIVGRTGAGKSSFLLILFRMAQIHQGSISVDGIDISHLPLHQLRSRLAIIPQTPTLFEASIRQNLDPLQQASEEEIWAVLDMCDLRGAISQLGGGLEAMVGHNGRNLSLGQKQLLCLARALLTKARILCLDEATASVDYATDQLIQRTLATAFTGCTIITIAHRLRTVMDYDRIVVMEGGRMVECDSPQRLLANPRSHFAMLYAHSQRSLSDSGPTA
ncbi:hypothetical protein RvY_18193 [Ramazzottius varieornatus]|uniref:ABC-type xenobiotic transporter n=1 Tax=Ramazzottius varieornatus TaxID=947166 RepID=A0A1D1W4Y7_RAMVA|nr:hypothetical protein RvY_18193 [Ramazzottius varieornatus]